MFSLAVVYTFQGLSIAAQAEVHDAGVVLHNPFSPVSTAENVSHSSRETRRHGGTGMATLWTSYSIRFTQALTHIEMICDTLARWRLDRTSMILRFD